MTAIFLLARLLSRDRNVLNALGAAALGVLVWSPAALFEASFQMTFLAIVAIGGIAIPLGERSFLPYARAAEHLWDKWEDIGLPPRVAQFRVMLRLWSETFAGVAGDWACGLPSLLVRWSSLGAGAGADRRGRGDGDGAADGGLLPSRDDVCRPDEYAERAAGGGAGSDGCDHVLCIARQPLGGDAAGCGDCSAAAWSHGRHWPRERSACRRSAGAGAGVVDRAAGDRGVGLLLLGGAPVAQLGRGLRWRYLPLVALMVLWPEPAVVSPGMMEVTAIDVGQGDSIFIVGPDGATMLVDAGGPVGGVTEAAEATSRFDVGEEVVSPYLWSRRFRRLDVLVLSHAHSDHMGGMPAVMRNFRPRELWVSIDPNSDAYRALLAEAKDLGVQVRHFYAGDQLAWGGTQVTILAPEAGYINPGSR